MQDPFKAAEALEQEIEKAELTSAEETEAFRIAFIGSKGRIKKLFGLMSAIEPSERKTFGQLVNRIKQKAESTYEEAKARTAKQVKPKDQPLDLSIPGYPLPQGSRHPISLVREEMIHIFERMGFAIASGPEIEDDWHNFTALNLPADHPARDMQDTFYIDKDNDMLLRTHSSSTQIRVMEERQPPIRVITPGRVYRNETISARAHCTFHQVEGLFVDKNVSFADLKQTLYQFAKDMFGSDSIRLRPSYFPFTEPSAELDVSCFICNTKGCKVCKHTGWVEIGGCGMVDPAVFDYCKIDSEKYTGFAFGMGIERIAMLRYGIDDIRLFFQNDIRFLKQFSGLS